jgi:hypothetical protein
VSRKYCRASLEVGNSSENPNRDGDFGKPTANRPLTGTKPDQIRSDQIRSDQIRSDQIRSDQIR